MKKDNKVEWIIKIEPERREDVKEHVKSLTTTEGKRILLSDYIYSCHEFFNEGWQDRVKDRDRIIRSQQERIEFLTTFIKESIPGIVMVGDTEL